MNALACQSEGWHLPHHYRFRPLLLLLLLLLAGPLRSTGCLVRPELRKVLPPLKQHQTACEVAVQG